MSKPPSVLRLLIPGATLYLSSGCIVILEVVASRLVARALGSSPYTWTFVAAVVLASLTIGSFAGGRIADRFHPRRALAVLLALASSACVALVIVNNVIGQWGHPIGNCQLATISASVCANTPDTQIRIAKKVNNVFIRMLVKLILELEITC